MPPQQAQHLRRRPLGLAAFAGALAEWETIDEEMQEIVEARQRADDRPPPFLP